MALPPASLSKAGFWGRRVAEPPARLGRVHGDYSGGGSQDKARPSDDGPILVMVNVTSPVETVRSEWQPQPLCSARRMCLCMILAGLVVALISVIRPRSPPEPGRCFPIHVPHAVLQGDCNGTRGAECTYIGCADGYELRRTDQGSAVARPMALHRDAVNFPLCATCYGDGIFCERNVGAIAPLCTPCGKGIDCSAPGNCTAAGGVACAASRTLPCASCTESAHDSDWLACELGSLHWDQVSPNLSTVRADVVRGWPQQSSLQQKVYCLSTPPHSCFATKNDGACNF